MIDLHILNDLDSTQPAWLGACLASAERAARLGLCAVHLIENPGPHIGRARVRGFSQGVHEFVAGLDNDDVLVPEGIPGLLEALNRDPELCGVYSDRQQIDEDGNLLFTLDRSPWKAVNQLCQTDWLASRPAR